MKKMKLLPLLAVLLVTLCAPVRAAGSYQCYGQTAGAYQCAGAYDCYGLAAELFGCYGRTAGAPDCVETSDCAGAYDCAEAYDCYRQAAACSGSAGQVWIWRWNGCPAPRANGKDDSAAPSGNNAVPTNDNETPSNSNAAPDNAAPAVPSHDDTVTPNGGNTGNTPDNSGASAYEKEVVRLVNEVRAQNGLQPLTLDAELCRGARAKSQDMADKRYFDHNSPTYGTPFQMMKTFGITYRTAGENIAYGYATPQTVMDGWMNSSGHRANILNGSYTRIGVGYVANGNYWTQWFAG